MSTKRQLLHRASGLPGPEASLGGSPQDFPSPPRLPGALFPCLQRSPYELSLTSGSRMKREAWREVVTPSRAGGPSKMVKPSPRGQAVALEGEASAGAGELRREVGL